MKVLIGTGPGIGDVIQYLSMARAIKEKYPNSRVDLIMKGSLKKEILNKQILECQDYVDNLYWYSSNQLIHSLTILIKLAMVRYDVGFVEMFSISSKKISRWQYYIMKIAGCKTIVGSGYSKLNINVDIPENAHYLERNARFLDAIGIEGRKDAVSINPAKLDNNWLNHLKLTNDREILAFVVGTNPMKWLINGEWVTYDVKSWMLERWVSLAIEMESSGYAVLLLGGQKEKTELEAKGIHIPSNKNIYNFIGESTVKQSITLLNICRLVVGSEGGMMHCASALGKRTLTIFGGSNFKKWNPGGPCNAVLKLDVDCYPCFGTIKAALCDNHKCLNQITVDHVKEEILRLIK